MSIRQGALRLTLSYMLGAGLWVLLSDRLLSVLDLPIEQFEHLQSLKGLGFVVLPGAFLRAQNCNYGQGYFGRPQPATGLTAQPNSEPSFSRT